MIQRNLIGTSLQVKQSKGCAFNLDTILLANFIKVKKGCHQIVDFGTGNASLLLYLSQKTKAKLIGLEVQNHRVLLAKKNVEINDLSDQIDIIEVDINDYNHNGYCDMVISNPPFFKVHHQNHLSDSKDEQIARHEVLISLKVLIEKMSKILNNKGYFYMIHRPERLDEIIYELGQNGLTVKRVRFVHPYVDKRANHVLIEAQKFANASLIVEPPLILYAKKHIMTDELIAIYNDNIT